MRTPVGGWAVLAAAAALAAAVVAGSALAQGPAPRRAPGGMGAGMCPGGCRMMDVTSAPIDPGALPEPRSRGAGLLVSRCTQCHGLVSPRQHAADEWPPIVARMQRRMEMMSRGMGMMGRGMGMMRRRFVALTPAQESTLVAYLQRNAFRAAPAPAPGEGEAARAFYRTCSRCHAPPDPTIHTAGEWNAVVDRMAGHMEQQGFGPLPPAERTLVLRHLDENARR